MVKMQPYVKMWYDYLEEGKIMGLKCKKCGAYEFPPVPVCNSCSGTELEWVEMKGTGKLISFSIMQLMDKVQVKYGRRYIGQVQLTEGPAFTATLEDFDLNKREELYDRLPADVNLGIMQFDGFKFVSFKLKD